MNVEQRILASGRVRVDDQGRIFWTNSGQRAEHRAPHGYLQVRVMLDGVRLHAGAHRVVWTQAIGALSMLARPRTTRSADRAPLARPPPAACSTAANTTASRCCRLRTGPGIGAE